MVLSTPKLQVLLVKVTDHFLLPLYSDSGLQELSDKKFPWTAERQSNRAILFSPRATRAGTYSMGSDEPQVCQKKAGCALGMLHSSHSVILQWAIPILGYFLNSGKRPAIVQNCLDFHL